MGQIGALDIMKGNASTATGRGNQLAGFSTDDRAKMFSLLQPDIQLQTDLSSDDPAAFSRAAAPMIANTDAAFTATQEQLKSTMPSGAARDRLLAKNLEDKNASIANFQNQIALQAPEKLATIGSGIGSFGLQEGGEGLGYANLGEKATEDVASAQEASKASTMGFLGQLVGAGGMLGAAGIKKAA